MHFEVMKPYVTCMYNFVSPTFSCITNGNYGEKVRNTIFPCSQEHTTMTDLFSYLWFNEINLFRSVLAMLYIGSATLLSSSCYPTVNTIHCSSCTYKREHSSKVKWTKMIDEIVKKGLKDSRRGLGL
jgi:hypothetical protein